MYKIDITRQLTQLDDYEIFGKAYRKQTGKNLSYGQFLTLSTHYGAKVPLALLDTPEFRARQAALEGQLHVNSMGSLSEAMFFREDSNIEVEKLYRYIDIPVHRHGFMECSYVLQGSCNQIVNGNTYHQSQGTFSMITTGTDHEIIASDDCVCLTLKIRSKTFVNLRIPNLPVFAAPVYAECGNDPFIRDRMLEIYHQQQEQPAYHDLLMESIFTSLLLYLCQAYHDSLHYFLPGSILQDKLLVIATYMFENYETITLHSLAQHFHYSDAYLSNLFRQKAGTTFTEVLRTFKLEQAKNLLLTTKLKLGEVCERVGYRDTSQFIRDFKDRFGYTPIQYRKLQTQLD